MTRWVRELLRVVNTQNESLLVRAIIWFCTRERKFDFGLLKVHGSRKAEWITPAGCSILKGQRFSEFRLTESEDSDIM